MCKYLSGFFLICLILCSCGATKDIAYFQDVIEPEINRINSQYVNIIKEGDIISILVTSSNPELAVPYNLLGVRSQMNTSSTNSYVRSMEGYTVNKSGEIDFPVLGFIHVAGMTREELSEYIKELLKDTMPDPVVSVNFINFTITVIGEVVSPGTFTVDGDRLTILQALSLAGDLSIYGKRTNVLVIRENEGLREMARIDLRSKELFESPYFYLQQNDVLYVEPIRAKGNSISPFRTNFSTAVAVVSMFSSITMAIFYINR